jgi:hypothetical protein
MKSGGLFIMGRCAPVTITLNLELFGTEPPILPPIDRLAFFPKPLTQQPAMITISNINSLIKTAHI